MVLQESPPENFPSERKIIAHFEIEILSSDAFIIAVQLICHIQVHVTIFTYTYKCGVPGFDKFNKHFDDIILYH